MGRAKNSLTQESVSSTPVKFRYRATYESASFLNYGITANIGKNYAYTVPMSAENMREMNVYRMIRQLYYQVAISSSLNISCSFDPMWQSTAASTTGVETIYRFPTGSGESILVLCVPSSQFGENFGRTTFVLSSSVYDIRDDGNGNLRDFKNSGEHVGNVFYAQGIAVITNDEYATPDCNRLNTEDYYDIQTQNYQVICIPTGSYVDTCNYLNTQDNYDMLTQNYADICIPTGSFVDDFNYLDTQDYEDIQTQAYGDILT